MVMDSTINETLCWLAEHGSYEEDAVNKVREYIATLEAEVERLKQERDEAMRALNEVESAGEGLVTIPQSSNQAREQLAKEAEDAL